MAEDLRSLRTEQVDPRFSNLDEMSIGELCNVMNEADALVPDAIAKVLPQIEKAIEAIVERMSRGGRLIYIGAGTSGRLGVLDASECRPTFSVTDDQVLGLIAGGDRALRFAIEGAEDDPQLAKKDLAHFNLNERDVLVGLAASGRTPYVIGAIEYAKEIGALTVAITCNPNSKLGKLVEHPIEVDVGPEILTGSTRLKSGTAQKLVLNMISTISMIRLGKTYGNLMVDLQATNEKLKDRAIRILEETTQASRTTIEQTLVEAGNSVKVALIMLMRGVGASEARELLLKAGNQVRQALK